MLKRVDNMRTVLRAEFGPSMVSLGDGFDLMKLVIRPANSGVSGLAVEQELLKKR